MDLLNKLTIKNLKLNKKRTTVTIIGIILSVALLSAVCSMFMSTRQSLIDFETAYKGNYHFGFLGLNKNEVETLKLNAKVDEITIVETIGYAKLDKCKNDLKPYVCLKASNKNTIKNMGIKLLEGRLPENNHELLITKHIDTNGGIELKVGEKITLNIGNRKTVDNYILDQNNPYQEDEILEEFAQKEYTIVGIIERQSSSLESYSAPGYTVITCFENDELKESVKYDTYVRYNKDGLKKYAKTTANILEIDEEKFTKAYSLDNSSSIEDDNEIKQINDEISKSKYEFICNSYLIMIENGIAGDGTLKALGVVVIILFVIIIITSIFCIKNSFDISITEKIRQYGMLASIGATKKQIKRNVYYESMILSSLGIPLGIIFGNIAAFILMKIANLLLSEFLTFTMVFKFSWLAILFATLLGIITVLLSARKSANKASKISPIVAIRNSGDIKIKAKKLRTPWIIKKVFGIGGEISYKNLKRSRKKYRTTIISISICVITFIAVYSFMNIANSVLKLEMQTTNYNLGFSYPNFTEEEYKKLDSEVRNWSEIENATREMSKVLYINTNKYTDDFKMNNSTNAITHPEWNFTYTSSIKIYAIDEISFKEYVNKLNLKYDDVKDKGILLNSPYGIYEDQNHKTIMKYIDIFDIKVGESIQGKYIYYNNIENKNEDKANTEDLNIEIAKITNETPLGISTVYNNGYIITCIDEMPESFKVDGEMICYTNTTDSKKTNERYENLQEIYKENYTNVLYDNMEESVRAIRSLYLMVEILLYGFIIVIALIGITNIFNTVTTNISLRAKEFASLKSIGMTKSEFNRMTRLESFFYCSKSLLISIPTGIVFSYLIYKLVSQGQILIRYQFPLTAVIMSFIGVFILIYVIMRYSIAKINKQNIIETIRNENI